MTDGFNKQQLDNITQCINKVSEVKKVKDIKARFSGNNILLDVTVIVSRDLNVVEGHNVTEEIEKNLKSDFNITEIVVHVEPEV